MMDNEEAGNDSSNAVYVDDEQDYDVDLDRLIKAKIAPNPSYS
jgi:hypothetical protein